MFGTLMSHRDPSTEASRNERPQAGRLASESHPLWR
jgi:hypothetical protein